ncbi:MAG: NEW3 domain-containing protein, partial [Methanobacteriota archaeon]
MSLASMILLVALAPAASSLHGGAHVTLTPDFQETAASAGTSAAFHFDVRNNGTAFETVDLRVSAPPSGWTANVTPSEATLAPGGAANITLVVSIPAGAPNGTVHDSVVTATTRGNNSTADDAVARVRVVAPPPPPPPPGPVDLSVPDITL